MSVIMNQKKEILEKLAFIRRHKEFASFGVKEQEVSYNPCLSEEDIKEFEHKHCITLPLVHCVYYTNLLKNEKIVKRPLTSL